MLKVFLVSNQLDLYDSSLYNIINIEEAVSMLSELPEISLDTETQGLDCYTKKLLLIQLGNDSFQILVDIQSYDYKIPLQLVNFLNNSEKIFIIQNAKFDLKFLFIQGVLIKKVFDTMLAETILTNGLQYGGRDLATLAEKYCQVELDKSVRGKIITKGLSDEVLIYGARDIEHLSVIKRKQMKMALELGLVTAINLDNSFVVVLAYVEFCGIKLDLSKWLKLVEGYKKELFTLRKELSNKLYQDFGNLYFSGMQDLFTQELECTVNWDSPKQVIEIFNRYGIKTTTHEKGVERESVESKILQPQAHKFDILPVYLKYKELAKLVSTYGDNWRNYINGVTGRIHTTFKQLVDTGRLSCGNKDDKTPNIQNVPSDKETRSCFIAEEGNLLCSCDYNSKRKNNTCLNNLYFIIYGFFFPRIL